MGDRNLRFVVLSLDLVLSAHQHLAVLSILGLEAAVYIQISATRGRCLIVQVEWGHIRQTAGTRANQKNRIGYFLV